MLLICWSTFIAFSRERNAYDRARRAQLVDHIGDYYGLEVEGQADPGILDTTPRWARILHRFGFTKTSPAETVDAVPIAGSARDGLAEGGSLPAHASEGGLLAQGAEPVEVSTDDVDEVVDRDPRPPRDVQEVPERGGPMRDGPV